MGTRTVACRKPDDLASCVLPALGPSFTGCQIGHREMHVVESLVVGPVCTGQAVKRQNGVLLTGRAMWSRSQPQGFARARATSTGADVEWRRALKRSSGDPCSLCCQQIIPPPTALAAPAQVVNRPNMDDDLLLPAGKPPDVGPEL